MHKFFEIIEFLIDLDSKTKTNLVCSILIFDHFDACTHFYLYAESDRIYETSIHFDLVDHDSDECNDLLGCSYDHFVLE